MFATHQKQIEKACKSDINICAEALQFVSRSIRNHFYRMPIITFQENTMGVEAPSLQQQIKREAFEYINANKKFLHKNLYSNDLSVAEKILSMTSIPGIGIVKAGFIVQLCTGQVGCLDVHNLKMFGLTESTFKFSKSVRQNTALAKINLYIETCQKLGGSEFLWDNWCEFIAKKYPKHFKSAEEISKMHVDLIIRDKM
ncbi:MAG: hypothetical protein VW518_01425 [Burkholderiaceae bacterium]